ncbi:MAG: DNA polymerase I [Clostridia bacterium]|nr:DNA polymerase I [Clostridia bacterium]
MERLLILDSNSIINRAFYGVGALSAPDGTPTNGIYGFINMLLKLINDHDPQYILAAFDLKAPTFRHKMYDAYKANRHGMPDELAAQLPVMKDILRQMNIPILEMEGYEADDIIGTVSRMCGEDGIECYIATGDRDDLQLAGSGTTIVLASTKFGRSITELFDEKAVYDKYGVTPTEFIDLKALMGDKSDNIPGVSGIGEKTAAKLISQFSTIEKLYEDISSADVSDRIKAKLTDERDMAFLSKELARIDTHVPLDAKLTSERFTSDAFAPELYSTLSRLGLKSIIKKLDLTPAESGKAEQDKAFFDNKSIIVCADTAEFKGIADTLSGTLSLWLEVKDGHVIASLSDGKTACCAEGGDELTDALKPILENEDTKKITAMIKPAMTALAHKTDIRGIIFDCAVAAYLDDPSRGTDIDSLAAHYLGVYLTDELDAAQLSLFDSEPASDKAARYALLIHALYDKLQKRIEENGQHELYYNVELPLIGVLSSMEVLGFTLDTDELAKFGAMLSDRMKELEAVIYEQAGEEFNINSPKQLGVILFEKLGMKGSKKTKSGYSTKADILEKLAPNHKIVRDVLEYRSYQKLKSTYCDSLATLVDPETNRIHTTFHQTVTVTGRLSSSDPNLQNIPTRTALGRELRRMFAAADGCILVDADYSQIELRVLAHLSGDEAMIAAFNNGEDIHAVTASKILGIPINELTREQRASAKAINFGIVYGMSEFSLSQDLGISFREAKSYMDEYFNKYSGVRDFMNGTKAQAHKNGYVKTMMGRIRYIPELNSSNANLRGFGERAAMNTPVQGSAADIIKLAMVRVYDRLKSEGLRARLILQVHDELIIEAPESEREKVCEILQHEMENAVKLTVPLVAETACGKSWYDAK